MGKQLYRTQASFFFTRQICQHCYKPARSVKARKSSPRRTNIVPIVTDNQPQPSSTLAHTATYKACVTLTVGFAAHKLASSKAKGKDQVAAVAHEGGGGGGG